MKQQLEALYREERATYVKRFTRRAGSPENAEDVVQEAFTRALKYSDSYDPTRKPLQAWFNTILNNALKAFKAAEYPRSDPDEEAGDDLTNEQITVEYAEKIREEINSMPHPRCHILHLWFNRGYTYDDINKVLDVPEGTIISVLYRFRQEMREKYKEAIIVE